MDSQHRRRRSWTSTVAVAAVLAVAGGLFATSAGTAQGTDLRASGTDLRGLVRQESSRLDERNAEVAELRAQVEALTAEVGDSTTLELQATAAELSGPAHLQAVSGPALTVSLDDAPTDRPVPEGTHPNRLVVHQQDVQAVVNALWAAGAEAMMLMDQRVISTSAVRCVGNTLRLQGRVYSPPFVVTAVGDPDELREALDDSAALDVFREDARAFGLGYEVDELDEVDVPAYDGSIEMRFARPVSGDGALEGDG